MGKTTGISWCHHTLNLWWGCAKVSPACDNCYAERDAIRFGHPNIWGVSASRWFLDLPKRMKELRAWDTAAAEARERRRVFINSMSDIGEQHPRRDIALKQVEYREALWRIIPTTPWLDYLLLTKRP